MKTAREFLKEIKTDKSNLDHIASTNIINGSMLIDLEKSMKAYAKEVAQQALIDASENLEPNNCYYNGSHCDLDAHRKEILNTPINLI
jgi:hypothetical protein